MKTIKKIFKIVFGIIFIIISIATLYLAIYNFTREDIDIHSFIREELLLSILCALVTIIGLILLDIIKTNKKKRKDLKEKINFLSSSSMFALTDEDITNNYKDIPKLIRKIDGVKIVNTSGFDSVSSIIDLVNNSSDLIELVYEKEYHFAVRIKLEIIKPDELSFLLGRFINKKESKKYMKSKMAINLTMKYGDCDPCLSFKLQLLLLKAMVPNLTGILDLTAGRILGPNWVNEIIERKTLPLLRDLYEIHYIQDSNYWLHTSGLNRCLIPEFEIIGFDKNFIDLSFNIIEGTVEQYFYDNIIDKEYAVGKFGNKTPIVTRLVDYNKGFKMYSKDTYGTKKDRVDNSIYASKMIFVFKDENDYRNKKYSLIEKYGDTLKNDYIIYHTDEENEKYSKLAIEKIDIVKKYHKGNNTLITIKKDDTIKNVIISKINNDSFIGTTFITPFDIDKTEEEVEFNLNDILFWELYMDDIGQINPTTTYLVKK